MWALWTATLLCMVNVRLWTATLLCVLTVLKGEIARKEVTREKVQSEVQYWLDYKEKDHLDYETQIRILQQELADMQNTFDVMAGQWRCVT